MQPNSRKDNKGRVLKTGENQRKNGTYEYRYTDPVTKKRCSVYAPTLKDLRKKEGKILLELDRGVRYQEGDITVSELTLYHLNLKTNLRQTTWYTYKTALSILSKYPFANMKIRLVKPSDCKIFAIKMQEDGYAYGTIKIVSSLCKEAFHAAVEDDLLFKNPWRFKLRSVIKNNTVKRKSLTIEETNNLVELLSADKISRRYKDTILFLLETGLRISEFCGLTIHDFDFDNRIVIIKRQLIRGSNGVMYISPPKSDAGNREVWLTDLAIESAQNLITNRNPQKLHEPIVDGISDFLVMTAEGKPKYARLYEEAFKKIKRKYAQRYGSEINFTPHILRHTFATRASEAELTVKSLIFALGHTTAQMSLDRYADNSAAHTAEEMKKKFPSGLTPIKRSDTAK